MIPWDERCAKAIGRIRLVSTYRKILLSIDNEHWDNAHAYLDFFIEEARICYEVYRSWDDMFHSFFRDRDVRDDEYEGMKRDLIRLVNEPYNGDTFDESIEWLRCLELQAAIHRLMKPEQDRARDLVESLREQWRSLHDRQVDVASGMMTQAAIRYGEVEIEALYRDYLTGPHFEWRYRQFDPNNKPWSESLPTNVYLSIEAMRSHLCGETRQGDVELEEDDEKFVLRFDPCGSGGRTVRGEPQEGTGSRHEAPYHYGYTTESHDWAWNKKGVCFYCAHCCMVLEKFPMETWGAPVRVVEPPTWPDRKDVKCSWTIYKELDNVPAAAYERLGHNKPDKIG